MRETKTIKTMNAMGVAHQYKQFNHQIHSGFLSTGQTLRNLIHRAVDLVVKQIFF